MPVERPKKEREKGSTEESMGIGEGQQEVSLFR